MLQCGECDGEARDALDKNNSYTVGLWWNWLFSLMLVMLAYDDLLTYTLMLLLHLHNLFETISSWPMMILLTFHSDATHAQYFCNNFLCHCYIHLKHSMSRMVNVRAVCLIFENNELFLTFTVLLISKHIWKWAIFYVYDEMNAIEGDMYDNVIYIFILYMYDRLNVQKKTNMEVRYFLYCTCMIRCRYQMVYVCGEQFCLHDIEL